ncbi:lipid-A-disaccharide synthase [Parahaliea sp. F7430]|uniref:Lipid-A-disaccharide synthase n=1 Tax=Sediminihaliea albiluteola TaxID=2758564 RepID=A0A7W2TVI5_9GAMM|nr:lipid-A-disaccharide synthase [Sediminihaliea albiluteola]MBA6412740.1 lipid-A-disaccharide synthase [Sediminihaliea albiluteola]
MRIGILAGEASGDILGSRVLAALRERVPELQVEGIGGPLMEAQGLQSMFPMERLSVMGFVEPLKRLPELLRIRRALYRHFRDNPPDLFLGIDSPDFNLRLERKLREVGVKTAHLVSPTVWAWRQGRIKGIRRAVDRVLCLFPFELPIYQQHNVAASFVGHPLADEIPRQVDTPAARAALGLPVDGKVLALLPGSRGAEVSQLAPLFFEAARALCSRLPNLHVVLPAANPARRQQLELLLASYPDLPLTLVDGQSREIMAAADAVLLASGTATLEAMLLKRPMVVAYRMSPMSWALVSRLVKTPWASLPNILAGRALVPELIQNDASASAMCDALLPLLQGAGAAQEQEQAFDAIHQELALGFAQHTAEALLDMLAEGKS